jgi:hypothetical protein
MKTSDKLLLGTVLGAVLLFGGASLAVYARYKNGDILTEKEVYRQNHLKTALPAPGWLRIKGIDEVHFMPADGFAIEYEKGGVKEDGIIRTVNKNDGKIKVGIELVREPRYFRSGDTLIIDGYDPKAPEQSAAFRVRSLNVYGLKSGSVELESGSSYIDGDSAAGTGDYQFLLKQNRLQIGLANENDASENISFLRGLSVSASDGSEIELNPGVHIDDLRVELDSLSTLSEVAGWNIRKIHVQADGQAQLDISGSLWNKIMADSRSGGPADGRTTGESPVSGKGKGKEQRKADEVESAGP